MNVTAVAARELVNGWPDDVKIAAALNALARGADAVRLGFIGLASEYNWYLATRSGSE